MAHIVKPVTPNSLVKAKQKNADLPPEAWDLVNVEVDSLMAKSPRSHVSQSAINTQGFFANKRPHQETRLSQQNSPKGSKI